MADLTTLYRGQPWMGPSNYLKMTNQGLNAPGTSLNLTKNELSKLAGQYWSKSPKVASSYAGPMGKIRSMNVPSNYLDKFGRFEKSVVNLPSGKFAHAGAGGGNYLVPKSTLKNIPSSINYGQTLKNIGGTLNPIKNLVDEAKLIKSAYSLFGPGEALKDVGKLGLGYLGKGLTTLGSLPLQAGIMSLTPTPANADEADMNWEDFRRLAMKENFIRKQKNTRRNIPGTPLIPTGRSQGHKVITKKPTPSGNGGGGGGQPHTGGGYERGDYGGRGYHWAKGGRVDKALGGRSRYL